MTFLYRFAIYYTDMNKRYFLILLFLGGLCYSCNTVSTSTDRKSLQPIEYVNPFIGTGGKGKTYPGATVPFGMVQLSPDNGRSGWDWISGYFYPDTIISGFSHTHLSGTGIGDLYDISFMPFTIAQRQDSLPPALISSRFSHHEESASPGYYSVKLQDYDVEVSCTATTRTGLQHYQFKGEGLPAVQLNLGYTRNWDATTEAFCQIENDSTVSGYRYSTGWAKDQRIYFVSVFSEIPNSILLAEQDSVVEGPTLKGQNVRAIFSFEPSAKDVFVKTAISSVSIENAHENLVAEMPGFDFEQTRLKAQQLWNTELNKIHITSGDSLQKVQFYTAMYQSHLAPTVFSDVNGAYKGPDGNIHNTKRYTQYTTFSLWDTFRALHPLLTIINPEEVRDMIHSMLAFYEAYGTLPVWDLVGNETDMMIGYHAVPVIVDAYFKGIRDFDVDLAYEAMKQSAMQDKFGLKEFRAYGYIPYDQYKDGVSLLLEYAFDDWCIARMAKALGHLEDADYFSKRAMAYKKVYDAKTGFMRGKDSKGKWRTPFDPLQYNSGDYIEANAWQYNFFVPHDVAGMIELMGGKEAFIAKLDSMFEVQQEEGALPEWISGYIGQYVQGNEPAHHVPYLYSMAGYPDKAYAHIHTIAHELYHTDPAGICGNEDCGQMSAWYIFSTLGFYPVNPASGEYVLSAPLVDEATIQLRNDNAVHIRKMGQGGKINKVTWNGQQIAGQIISHADLMQGGELVFEMNE